MERTRPPLEVREAIKLEGFMEQLNDLVFSVGPDEKTALVETVNAWLTITKGIRLRQVPVDGMGKREYGTFPIHGIQEPTDFATEIAHITDRLGLSGVDHVSPEGPTRPRERYKKDPVIRAFEKTRFIQDGGDPLGDFIGFTHGMVLEELAVAVDVE